MFRCSDAQMLRCSDAQMLRCSNVQMLRCSDVHQIGCRDSPASVKVMTPPPDELRTEDKKLRMNLMKAKGEGGLFIICNLIHVTLHGDIAEQRVAYSSLELKMQM